MKRSFKKNYLQPELIKEIKEKVKKRIKLNNNFDYNINLIKNDEAMNKNWETGSYYL